MADSSHVPGVPSSVLTLLPLLERCHPRDGAEAEHLQRMQALARTGPGAVFRDNYSPGHFTASAFVLSPERTHLLVILHSKLGLWLQPGGHVERTDPTLEAAARREVAEETGQHRLTSLQDTPIDLDIHQIPARPKAPAHEHFDVRFLFGASSDALRANSDALQARWVPLCEVALSGADESMRRSARKIESYLAAGTAR